MKSILRSLVGSAVLAALFSASLSAATPSPGFVDFGRFSSAVGEQYVEVDVNPALLRLAAAFTRQQEPAVARLLGSLERVRVNVFKVNEDNRTATLDRINAVRDDLDTQGWVRVVTVREAKGDDVAVFIKQASDDRLHGVVVTVVSRDGEAVLVNVVGDVAIEQIAQLGESLNIDPLRKLKLTPEVES